MSSCPEIASPDTFLQALLAAPRPGSEKILAFYDSRVNLICTDPALLLLPLDDHMCHRGDGVFESIAFQRRRIFALPEHVQRLSQGAEQLGIAGPPDNLEALIRAVAGAANTDNGDLRVFLSRGPGGFGIAPAECPTPSLYIVALKAAPANPAVFANGISAFSSKIPPKQDYLARIKNTNYLPNVLMAMEAAEKKRDVAISFDSRGIMREAAIANAAIVNQNGTFVSPTFDGILPGTTLMAALRLASGHMPVAQENITLEDIANAREMLLFTSASLCVPITSFDDRPIGSGRPGPVSQWLRKELFAEMVSKGIPF